MGGDGGDKKTEDKTTATEHEIARRMIPAMMPGQQGLLAQQLAAGGYGTAPEWSGILGGMYSDMDMPIIRGSADIAALRKQLDAQGIKAGE